MNKNAYWVLIDWPDGDHTEFMVSGWTFRDAMNQAFVRIADEAWVGFSRMSVRIADKHRAVA